MNRKIAQVYATHFSCESTFKATAKIQAQAMKQLMITNISKPQSKCLIKVNDMAAVNLFNAFQAIGIAFTEDTFNLSLYA